MRGVQFFMFLVAIPAIAALGFDAYLYYMHQDRGFMLSTPGYIWTHYDPDSYKMTVENVDPGVWTWINFVLAQKSVVVGAAFAGFFYVLLGLCRILGLYPFNEAREKSGGGSSLSRLMGKKQQKFQYKRK